MGKHSRRPPEEREPRPIEEPDLLLPPLGLKRADDGRVVLDEVDVVLADVEAETGRVDDTDDADAAGRAGESGRVDGPIQPTPTIYFGRPPGTENRRAGAAAMIGALCLAAAAALPWATREPASLGATTMGWRDAQGALGPAPWMLLLAAVALVLAIAALSAVLHRALQVGDVLVGLAALAISVVEWFRIRDAADALTVLTDGRASMSPGWGVALGVAGGAAMLVAAVVHRATAPAWRQT